MSDTIPTLLTVSFTHNRAAPILAQSDQVRYKYNRSLSQRTTHGGSAVNRQAGGFAIYGEKLRSVFVHSLLRSEDPQ